MWLPKYGPAEESRVLFDVDLVRHNFVIVHNLPIFGLSFEDAFHNWIVRTEDYSAKSLKEYITQKDPENFRVIIRSEKIFNIKDN